MLDRIVSTVCVYWESRYDPSCFRTPHANALSSQTASPCKGKKSDTRPWVDLTNEAQHVETHKVSVECAEEESTADRLDPVWSQFAQKAVYVQCSRDV